MKFQQRHKQPLELGMTPMIDVVFLLLIFFMVTTTFNHNSELQIKLPESSGEAAKVDNTLEIAIDQQGVYYINRQKVVNSTMQTLKMALANSVKRDKKRPLIITADKNTPHQYVIRALDVAQQLGFVQISFATQQAAE